MSHSNADIAIAIAEDTYEVEVTEADGVTWITREDDHGDVRTLIVSDSSLIIDTRDADNEPIAGTEVVNITRPGILAIIGAVRYIF